MSADSGAGAVVDAGAAGDSKVESGAFPTSADDYVLMAEIGNGAFATVYRAKVTSTGAQVAIKILDLDQLNAR
jgi:serine/threonine protein kinase